MIPVIFTYQVVRDYRREPPHLGQYLNFRSNDYKIPLWGGNMRAETRDTKEGRAQHVDIWRPSQRGLRSTCSSKEASRGKELLG
jgi:hypothetical protein